MAPESQPVRTLVVDDHPITRGGLRQLLEDTGRFELVGEAADGDEAVRVALAQQPDLIIMDVILPGKDGIDACWEILEALPETRVVMLSAASEDEAVLNSIAAGAVGYLQKHAPPEELIAALVDASEDQLRVPRQAIQGMVAALRENRRQHERSPLDQLSELERRTLGLFASGHSLKQIAELRERSTVTVRNTLYRIQDRLGIDNKQELIVWAVRHGLVNDHDVETDR